MNNKKNITILSTILIAILLSVSAFAQLGTLRGTVIDDSNGETLPFSTIYVKEAQKGINTDLDGVFNISLA
ncbi:MAG: hypothetical protein ACI9DJ_002958, partial [Algoriphagus sp.]